MEEAAMEWNAAIERHRDTLKRILAALVALAGLAGGGATLPRHLHRAVLRLLRPAEAAARRLIIAQARGLVVALKARRQDAMALPRGTPKPKPSRPLGFPLLDPLRRPFLRRRPALAGVPRISVPGFSAPFPIAPPPSPDDPVDATRLGRRLAALALVLDDLPGQARRFARWRAQRDAAGAQEKGTGARAETSRLVSLQKTRAAKRVRRLWPLRPGSPPGSRRRRVHEIDDVLKAAHGLAFLALQRGDTS
jgi:hypothetical protein